MKPLQDILKKLTDTLTKPFAIILAGHNGAGKSTMWYEHLSEALEIPLINADRMMLSILPENRPLPNWAVKIRDEHESWTKVAQKGVEAFIAQAMGKKVNFARETVFSHFIDKGNGEFESKIDEIHQLQEEGYIVLLLFVGLSNQQLSIARVKTRAESLVGHNVPINKLKSRFHRTQKAISLALAEADISILVDNSRSEDEAFTICRVQTRQKVHFDIRQEMDSIPHEIEVWLKKVCPDYS